MAMTKVSVVIPSYERVESLKRCLASLFRQSAAPALFEIVVVVDGSTDGTDEYLGSLKTPFGLKILSQRNRGRGSARNEGANIAGGDYLLFLDDDIVAGPHLVAEHLRVQSDASRVVGIGRIEMPTENSKDWYTAEHAMAWNRRYEALETRVPGWQDLYSGNFSIPRSLFLDSGGFKPELNTGEDVELGLRLQALGSRFVYISGASGIHKNDKSRHDLIAQAYRQGFEFPRFSHSQPRAIEDLASMWEDLGFPKIVVLRLLARCNIPAKALTWLHICLPRKHAYRLHKLVQQYSFWNGVRQSMTDTEGSWASLTRGTPVLMYHAIAEETEQPTRFFVTSRRLEQQMKWLSENGYHVLSLKEFSDLRHRGKLPPSRSIVLTFDDGYFDFASMARPILLRFGFKATLFLVAGRVGKTNDWDSEGKLSNRKLLSWKDARQLLGEGFELGCHTHSHQRLINSTPSAILAEIQGARTTMTNRLGVEITSFSYPYGEYNASVRNCVSASGYSMACTADEGLNTPATDRYLLKRIEVSDTDGMLRFRLKLRFGVNCLTIRRLLKLSGIR